MSKERWTVVYAGFRFFSRTGDRYHLYHRVGEPGQLNTASGRELHFKKELLPASPGAILEVDVEVEADAVSVHSTGRRHVPGHLRDTDPELAGIWAAEDRAHSALAQAARGAMRDEFAAILKPIQYAYINSGPAQRAQLLAQVVRFITATSKA